MKYSKEVYLQRDQLHQKASQSVSHGDRETADPSRASTKLQVVRKKLPPVSRNHKQFPPQVGGAICSELLRVEEIISPDRNAKKKKNHHHH